MEIEGQGGGEASPSAPYVWMLGGCLAFAWMGELANLLRGSCDWRIVALARAVLVFVFALALAWWCRARLAFANPPVLWLRSIAGSLSLLGTFYAFSLLRTSEVMSLTNTFPIWVALLSWPVLRQRPTLSVWAAAACGVAGVWLIKGGADGPAWGVVPALFAAATSAVAMLGLNRLGGLHPWAVVAHFSGVATVFVLGTWATGGAPDLSPLSSLGVISLLLGVGASATIGQVCLTRAFTSGEPSRVSIVGLAQVPFALGLDLLFGGPMFSLLTLAGIALVLLPAAWVMSTRRAARPG